MHTESAGLAQLSLPGTAQVELHADVHLSAQRPQEVQRWLQYVQASQADALVILGDLFEVWIGDDWGLQDALVQRCLAVLQRVSEERLVFFMAGNRDFLLGPEAAAAGGMQRLADPCVLDLGGQRYLLSHGDAWVLADVPYQQFRRKVRTDSWQQEFLSLPLAERVATAQAMRVQSQMAQAEQAAYADVDVATAQAALLAADATTLIHGHTHRPSHDVWPQGQERWVLSDWDAGAGRGDVLQLSSAGVQRRQVLDLS